MKRLNFFLMLCIAVVLSLVSCDNAPKDGGQDNPLIPQKVDLGLPSGLKWASFNVGATKIDEYGNWYAWGCVESTLEEGWACYCHGGKNALTKYCTNADYGTVDNKTTLELSDDVANKMYGGSWRIPTREEAFELYDNCTHTWDSIDYVYGWRFTGKNGNSIFLPSSGWRDEQGEMHAFNIDAFYWTSSLDTKNNNSAYALILRHPTSDNKSGVLTGQENRMYVRNVRAVCP